MCINTTASWSGTPIDKSDILTIKKINAERAIVASAHGLNNKQRTEMLTNLAKARHLLQEADQLHVAAGKIKYEIRRAPVELKLLQNEREKKDNITAREISGYSTEKLKLMLAGLRTQLETSRAKQDEQEKLFTSYLLLVKNGGSEITDIHNRMGKFQPLMSSPGSAGNDADHMLVLAMLRMLTARLSSLKIKQDNINVLTALAAVRRDYYATQVSRLQKNIDQLDVALLAKSSAELKSARLSATKALPRTLTEFKPLQKIIDVLLHEQNELQVESSIDSQRLDRVKRLLDELQADQERMRQVIRIAGDHAQVSRLLQNRRALIPSASALTEAVIAYQSKLSTAVLRQLALDEMLRKTSPKNVYINTLLSGSVKNKAVGNEATLRQLAEQLRDSYRHTVRELNNNYTAYIAQLSSLDTTTRQLLKVAHHYRAFINGHLLWLPSTGSVPMLQPVNLLNGFVWLVRLGNLIQLLSDAQRSITLYRLSFILLVTVVISLLFFRRRVLSALARSAEATQKIRTDSFMATVIALISTFVLTLPVPLLLVGSGIVLGSSIKTGGYSLAIAAGLQGSGMTLLLLLFIRNLCRNNGLARIHLHWQDILCNCLQKEISWFIVAAIPLTFLFSMSTSGVPSAFIHLSRFKKISDPNIFALGQMAFVILMLLTTMVVYKIWRKKGPLMEKLATIPSTASWQQYHAVWFAPLMILPVSFVTVSMLGYYYSATFLIAKVGQTLWYILALTLLKDILARGLYVMQRRLRLDEALHNREELKKQREDLSAQTPASEQDDPVLDEETISYVALSDQVYELLRTVFFIGLLIALWWVWEGVIPALHIFNTIDLPISSTVMIDGVSKEVPLTLGGLISGLLY